MTAIAREVEVLISHPFCLPHGNAPASRYRRREQLERLRSALGEDEWELLDLQGVLPAVMKKRKDCLLRCKERRAPAFEDRARRLNEPYQQHRTLVSVTHAAWMWDFGLCSVDVRLRFRLNSAEGLKNVYDVAEAFEEEMLEEDLYLPPGMTSWAQVSHEFARAFREAQIKTIHWLTNEEAPNFRLETCCWNLLLVQPKPGQDSMSVTQAQIDRALEEFCGEPCKDETFKTGVDEFFATHTGYSGNAAVVVDDAQILVKVEWLWKAVALLYGALLEAVEPVYDIVVDLINDEYTASGSQDIRVVQKVIDMLHNEANPITICSESLDAAIYQKIWEAWGGDEIDRLVDARTAFLFQTLQDISAQRSQSLQQRLNFVVFVLTIVSVLSTVAAVLALLDTTNEVSATTRAVYLGVVTGLVGVMCLLIIATDVRRFIKGFRLQREAASRRVMAEGRERARRNRGSVDRDDPIVVKVQANED